MRKSMKKPFAYLLTLFLFMSSMYNRGVVVMADSGTFETQESVMSTEIANVETVETVFIPEETMDTESCILESYMEETLEETEDLSEILEYIPKNALNGIEVKAYACRGVFPEAIEMIVSEVCEGTEAHDQAQQALDASGLEYDQFKALDIRFVDVEGHVVEPLDGSVQVKISMDPSLFPEEMDTNTLALQHLNETSGAVQVETVGSMESSSVGVSAAFTVDSFSTFTITWKDLLSEYHATLKYVDVYGTEIQGTPILEDQYLSMGEVIELEDFAYAISGYTYLGARINGVDGENVKMIHADRSNDESYFRYSPDGQTWKDLDNEITVLLVYDGASIGTRAGVMGQSVSHEKYVELKEDGSYDLTLTVSGAYGSAMNQQKLDVVYVLDVSGSMRDTMGGVSKREQAGNAINTFTESLVENPNIDARFALVTFSGSDSGDRPWDDGQILQEWTSDGSAITSRSKPASNGGTNYQAGLRLAKTILGSRRADAQTAVIFISDGNPTYRYSSTGYTKGAGNSDIYGLNLDAAQTEVSTMGANYFFTVGVGPESEYDKLEDLKNSAASVEASNRAFYKGTDETALQNAFEHIQASMTYFLCSNVTITDRFTTYVEPDRFIVTVEDDQGNVLCSDVDQVVLEGVTIAAHYDSETRVLTLDFPEDYELKRGYTYKVTAHIDATETAYEAYRTNGYMHEGEMGTGVTSEGKAGFHTNVSAEVTYTYQGSEREESYPKPVIQLNPGTLIIEKEMDGLKEDEAARAYLNTHMYFQYTLNDQAPVEIPFQSFEWDETQGKYRYVLTGLSPDTTYSVSEEKGDLPSEYGYDHTLEVYDTEGSIGKGQTKIAGFHNQYAPSDRLLTVEKKVTGNMGERDRSFTFRLRLSQGDAAYTEPLTDTLGNSYICVDGTYTFTMSHGDEITWNIPYGLSYQLEEEIPKDYQMTHEGNLEGTITENISVCITNDRTMAAPTGIFIQIWPYITMILSGFLLFGIRRRIQ